LYTITTSGHREFLNWLSKEDPLEPTPKDIFKLKVYFADGMTKERLLKHFKSQLKKRMKNWLF